MIILLTGLPGSGKSLKASQLIYDTAYNEKSKEYGKRKRIYTNLDQFDFEKCNSETDIEFIPYSFEILHESLTDLYMMREESDEVLLQYCDEKHLSDALFIIDEAHNDFMKQDKVLIWWLSYHRHLHQDIILITQNKTLINSYYRHFPEFFYHAQPASKRIFSRSARYKVYSSFGHFKKDLIRKESVKIDKRYFSLYHSGDHQKPMNIIRRFAFIAGAFTLATFIVFQGARFFISGGEHDEPKPVAQAQHHLGPASPGSPVARLDQPSSTETKDILLTIMCSGGHCWDHFLNDYSMSQINEFIMKKKNALLGVEVVYASASRTVQAFRIRTNKPNLRKYLFTYYNSDTTLQEGLLSSHEQKGPSA